MSRIRAVPWINQAEFENVFEWLFSDRKKETKSVQRALDRIQTWSNRGQLPSSVEITGLLIETIIRDEQYGHTMSHKQLRLTYSMAIIRFVNALVDQEQNKKHAQTVLSIAQSINMPSWFVDLRHEGTHERLPSLSVLRRAAIQAVAWLHDRYWIQNTNRTAKINNEKIIQKIKTHMNSYKECRKAYLKGVKEDPTVYVDCIEELILAVNNTLITEEVIPLLLGTGGLVPSSKKKRATSEKMWISKDLIQIWTPLLQGISSVYSSFASELVSSMVKKLSSADDYVVNQRVIDPFASFETKDDPTKDPTYMLTLTCWLQYFVSELEDITVDCTLANLHKDDVLENCLKSPNTYTRSILQSLGQIDTEIAESIKPFMHYINQLLKNLDINKREKYDSLETITDEVLEKELDQMRVQLCEIGSNERTVKRQKRDVGTIKNWKLYENWKPCPIGMLPDGSLPCLDMHELLKE